MKIGVIGSPGEVAELTHAIARRSPHVFVPLPLLQKEPGKTGHGAGVPLDQTSFLPEEDRPLPPSSFRAPKMCDDPHNDE